MPSTGTNPAVVVVPIDLGTAAAFERNVFPLAYYDCPNNFSKGSLLIKSTVEEMGRIRELKIDLNQNEDFLFNTRVKLEDLQEDEEKLQENRKTLNPLKAVLNYRANKLFHAASRKLYLQTIRTSEKIHRENGAVRVVPSTQMRSVDDVVSPDAAIGGLCFELSDESDEDAKQTIIRDVTEMVAKVKDPFGDDSLVSQLRDGEDAMSLLSYDGSITAVDGSNRTSVASSDLQQSLPSSSKSVTIYKSNYNVILNSIVTTHSSNLGGFTHNQGSRGSGASVTQGFAP